MALHSGPAVLRDGNYVGPTVSRVSRLAKTAESSQILLLSVTLSKLSHYLDGVQVRDLGMHRLRDSGDSERIFQIVAKGLPESDVVPAVPNNLPIVTSSFVGRQDDLRRLRRMVRAHRLVSIVGFGGIGKTRLALQLANEFSTEFADGVWFVGLKDVDNAAVIPQAVADALHLPAVSSDVIEDVLLADMAKKHVLIVIDNAEHLLSGVAQFVHRLLQVTNDVRVIVTSRQPLRVQGERILRIAALDEAVRLFLERARSFGSALEMSETTSQLVTTICDRLGGIPLAIELAAARATSKTLEELQSIPWIEVAATPLSSTIEWSFRLLPPDEQRALMSLAAFDGSFSFEAAEKVAFDNALRGKSLGLLGSLTDKSLVSYFSDPYSSRYYLLEVVRDFLLSRLFECSELPAIRKRHCSYFLNVALALTEPNIKPQVSLEGIAREWRNIRAALRLALEDELEVERGRWLVSRLWPFWLATGRTSDAWDWIRLALRGSDVPSRLRRELLQRAAQIALGRNDPAAPALAKSLVEAQERAGDPIALGNALLLLANSKVATGAGTEAELHLHRALEQFRAADDRRGVAVALCALGTVAGQQKLNYAQAKRLLSRSLEMFTAIGDFYGCVEVLGNLTVTSMRAGEFPQALDYGERSLALLRRLGNDADAVLAHINIAEVYLEWGKRHKALEVLVAAHQGIGTGNRLYVAYFYEAAFKLAVDVGAHETAAQIYGYAQRQRHNSGTPLQPDEAAVLQTRSRRLTQSVDEATLASLVRHGTTLDTTAIKELIESLDAPCRLFCA
ncbi:MAG TPA: NB-ARC domain-containing protein [Candidatus Baltobacteraceae bacterium]